ncbi:hypothetical protein [uncultured Bacteroides sp.]|uniref:hypothetical protein n=1 Tax=uncultured Bacteroides sp. TaxID=162156 RepID=UPI00280B91FB|nr:hypothetical protein [uncultured Bacteroides sp.]
MAVEGIKFTVDVSRINQMIKDLSLTNREARSAIRRGLAAAGGIIRKQAVQNLRSVSGKNGRINYQPMQRFVKFKVYKDLGGVRIDILGGLTRKQSASYRKRGIKDIAYTLKFFDLGTGERYNKTSRKLSKKRYTGRIQASNFFQNAVKSKQTEAQTSLNSLIEKYINRIAAKK